MCPGGTVITCITFCTLAVTTPLSYVSVSPVCILYVIEFHHTLPPDRPPVVLHTSSFLCGHATPLVNVVPTTAAAPGGRPPPLQMDHPHFWTCLACLSFPCCTFCSGGEHYSCTHCHSRLPPLIYVNLPSHSYPPSQTSCL